MLSSPALSPLEAAAIAVEGLRHAARETNDWDLASLVSWMDNLVRKRDLIGVLRFAELVEDRNLALNSAAVAGILRQLRQGTGSAA